MTRERDEDARNEFLPQVRRPEALRPAPVAAALPVTYATAEPPLADTVEFRQILALLRRRRAVLGAVFLAVVSLVMAYTWMVRPVYKATANLLVDTKAPTRKEADLPVLADLLGVTQGRSVETQAEIIRSPRLEEQARGRLTPAERDRLAGGRPLEVKVCKNTDVIAVSALSYDPRTAAKMANAVCEEYIASSQQTNREDTRTAADYVLRQMGEVRAKLEQSRAELKQYKQRNATFDLTAESQERVRALSQLQSQVQEAEAARAGCRAQLAALGAPGAGASEVVDRAASPTANAIKGELVKLEMERTTLLQEYTPGSPEAKRMERRVAEAQAQLRREAEASLSQDRAPLQAQLWALEARARALSSAERRLRTELSSLPEQEYRLAQLTNDLQVLHQTHQLLNERYQALRISEEARLANARVVSPAIVPAAPEFPRRGANLALALLLGLALAVGAAAVVDRLDCRVHTDADAEQAAHAPVLTLIPFFRDDADRSLLSRGRRTPELLESVRMLRTNLMLAAVDEPLRSLVVTSSASNEGKTLTSLNVAVAMALDGKRVVLVDADLRHPSLHRHFGVAKEVGLTSVIAGACTLEQALQETPIAGLQLLASGPLPPNPPELLNSRAGRACLQELLEIADLVVVDSPPALLMADAHVLSGLMDGVLLVASCDQTGKHLLGKTSSLLRQNGGRVLGVLLNKADTGYGGYYGYHYGPYVSHDRLPTPAAVGARPSGPASALLPPVPGEQAAYESENAAPVLTGASNRKQKNV